MVSSRFQKKKLLSRITFLTLTSLFTLSSNIYAASPEAPPGGLNFQAGADKASGWLLFLIPILAAFICGVIAFNGLMGVKEHQKRAEAKDLIQDVVKWAIVAWIISACVKTVFAVIGIKS
ncbi:hypothetical protein ERICIV_04545 (plasmid) [Paenibacillus larvae subsp. larvae]|uniref:Uncharacterized protein n=1 Tax=Paenibacillus larvae subsp. larvae TaxID=147375 RepID=A0A2L1U7L6_9BACL|nr:hypothetical protein [Paenibacillus larvae]AQZ49274.1 hypothetical protein B5S25_22470 [Paenibacillus larvae subsp. pulvifaciens]AVF28927.1 hypothetical protein ERICIII_04925 [Paenibacillus larvae subsp. larvae]AVF33309.1 hypothetical protein ERICIV_04545 [Paenibacillus larvae subsp. larvae]MBH0344817.1 hypothetical protein [Paenibacillus larvae]MCY9774276.1 hypothetical protein [Paenibacillus larvae]